MMHKTCAEPDELGDPLQNATDLFLRVGDDDRKNVIAPTMPRCPDGQRASKTDPRS
ncbi:MAG: hypothetical protein VB101_09570 [Rhodospirillaceae bacterium]|nr:hypothetical protein [Rhodospirillaceae bacterium]